MRRGKGQGAMRNKLSRLAGLVILAALFAACSIVGDLDDYALKPADTPDIYTVTFNANEGYPVPDPQPVERGGRVGEPAVPDRAGYVFGGWYKEASWENPWNFDVDTVAGNIILYAKWDETNPDIRRIIITAYPAKISYSIGEGLNLSGLEVSAIYWDSSIDVVTGYSHFGFNSNIHGSKTVTVNYQGHTAQFTVMVNPPDKNLVSLDIDTPPSKTVYAKAKVST